MVPAPLPPLLILGGRTEKFQTKIIGRDLSKKLNLGGAKFKGGPKILGGPMNIVGKGAGHTPPFSKIPPF